MATAGNEAIGSLGSTHGGSKLDLSEVPRVPVALYNLRLDPELKALCGKLGLRRGGRKAEVLERLIHSWNNDAPQARKLIQEFLGLSSSAMQARGHVPATAVSSMNIGQGSLAEIAGMARSLTSGLSPSLMPGLAAVSEHSQGGPPLRCICTSHIRMPIGKELTCKECGFAVHAHCVGIHSPGLTTTASDKFVCPQCVSATLLPFRPGIQDYLGFKAKVQYLPAASPLQLSNVLAPNQITFEFEVPAPLAGASGGISSRRLELRCFLAKLLNTSSKRFQRWPLRTRLFLNGRELPVHQLPQSWDGHAYKDRNEDAPLVLGPHVRPGRNRLFITSYDPQPHLAVLMVCDARTPDQLMSEIAREHTTPESTALSHVLATFGDPAEQDDDIVAGAARLSLIDPLSHMLIRVPARAATCRHLECFDLRSYIELAQATAHPQWTCPLCSAPARTHELRVDSWTARVIKSLEAEQTEVEVQPDGSFAAYVPQARGPNGLSSTSRKRRREKGSGANEGAGGTAEPLGAADVLAMYESQGIDDGGATVHTASSSQSHGNNTQLTEIIETAESGDDEDHPICLSDSD